MAQINDPEELWNVIRRMQAEIDELKLRDVVFGAADEAIDELGDLTPLHIHKDTDEIVIRVEGTLAANTVIASYMFVTGRTVSEWYLYCKDKGASSSTIIDVNLLGVGSVFASAGAQPTLPYNDSNGWVKAIPNITTFVEGDVLTFDIDQIAPGAGNMLIVGKIIQPSGNALGGAEGGELTEADNTGTMGEAISGLSWDVSELRGDGTRVAHCPYTATLAGLRYSALQMDNIYYGDAAGNWTLYAVKNGSRVLTASGANFYPSADTDIDGFELELNSGLGSVVTYTPLDEIESGTAAANDDYYELDTTFVIDSYYSIEGAGGPWKKSPGWIDEYAFYFGTNLGGITGAIGLDATGPSTTAMSLALGAIGLAAEAISANYARVYIKAAYTTYGFGSADTGRADNTGSISYVLRNARADGRRIALRGLQAVLAEAL